MSSEMMYADDFVSMSKMMVRLMNELINWKEDFGSMGLKINREKPK